MRNFIGTMVLLTVTLALTGSVLTFAGTEKNEKAACLFHSNSFKGAKYEVTNLSDGVTIKITSDKPEIVKQIQGSTAKCRAIHNSGGHKGMCPMMKDKANTSRHEEGAGDRHHGEDDRAQ